MSGLGDVGTNLSSWWRSIPDEVKHTALRGTIGAGVGGLLAHTATGGFADREYRPGGGPALLGARLGGGVAAGVLPNNLPKKPGSFLSVLPGST